MPPPIALSVHQVQMYFHWRINFIFTRFPLHVRSNVIFMHDKCVMNGFITFQRELYNWFVFRVVFFSSLALSFFSSLSISLSLSLSLIAFILIWYWTYSELRIVFTAYGYKYRSTRKKRWNKIENEKKNEPKGLCKSDWARAHMQVKRSRTYCMPNGRNEINSFGHFKVKFVYKHENTAHTATADAFERSFRSYERTMHT